MGGFPHEEGRYFSERHIAVRIYCVFLGWYAAGTPYQKGSRGGGEARLWSSSIRKAGFPNNCGLLFSPRLKRLLVLPNSNLAEDFPARNPRGRRHDGSETPIRIFAGSQSPPPCLEAPRKDAHRRNSRRARAAKGVYLSVALLCRGESPTVSVPK